MKNILLILILTMCLSSCNNFSNKTSSTNFEDRISWEQFIPKIRYITNTLLVKPNELKGKIDSLASTGNQILDIISPDRDPIAARPNYILVYNEPKKFTETFSLRYYIYDDVTSHYYKVIADSISKGWQPIGKPILSNHQSGTPEIRLDFIR